MHEANDFTPWLAKNLPSLDDALGMKLESVRHDALVGIFSLGILTRDRSNDKAKAELCL